MRPAIVLGGVLVLRRIAAADIAALEAEAKMHPGVADRQAFFASIRRVRLALKLLRSDGAEVGAVGHASSLTQLGERASRPLSEPVLHVIPITGRVTPITPSRRDGPYLSCLRRAMVAAAIVLAGLATRRFAGGRGQSVVVA